MHRPVRFALAALMLVPLSSGVRQGPSMFPTAEAAQQAAPETPGPGVPRPLAEDRAARLSNVRCALDLSVPEDADTPVGGTVTITFDLADPSRPLALDFAGRAIRWVRVQGAPVETVWRDEHVMLPASALRPLANEVSIGFESSDLPLNRSRDFLYSLFVPARARLAFPGFDQPDVKARYRLSLEVPTGWEAIGNGAQVEHREDAGRRWVAFAETAPLPTYLVAFAAGRFSIETAERNGRHLRMLHRETDAAKVARNRVPIFDLHAAALEWLEQYTGIPYPFGKFDFLLVPSFQFGGMEHPGAIFYNAQALLLDPSATQNQKLGRATLIAHETAHMWFGDLVTMRWFDDVWMKEVFANFIAAKIVNPAFPDINHDLRFLYAHYPPAYDVDRTAGTNPIRQRLDNLDEAGSLYGAIIYQKAPIVMRQLEMILGEQQLREGLRAYLERHAFGNASWLDLIRLLDGRTSDDLAGWSRAWVEEEGRPTVRVQVRKNGADVELLQDDPVPGRDLEWAQRLQIVRAYPGGPEERIDHVMRSRAERVTTGAEEDAPDAPYLYVLPTGGGIGYGDFVLDERSRTYLSTALAEVAHDLTRGAALVTLWEEMLGGRVSPGRMFELLLGALPRETDELNVQRMLACVERLYWKFLSEAERNAEATRLERVLRAGIDRAAGASLKSAWFNTLRDTATTPATLSWLERIWSGAETVTGLTLAEQDFMTLALELAVRAVPSWARILEEQARRIENPDRRAQFEFVRPALAADAAVRDAFFERLRHVANRRREAWVLQGVQYLHHPLRAAASERHLPEALRLLQEIQRTGDIFFPKRWMDATLSGHRSASAAREVSGFVERLPAGYPDRLRRIILSSADDLFRASRYVR